MDAMRAHASARDEHDNYSGRFALSVASRPGMSADELAQDWDYIGKHYRITTAGEIRQAAPGADVVEDGDGVHALLCLPGEPDPDFRNDPVWPSIDQSFPEGEWFDNPKYQHR